MLANGWAIHGDSTSVEVIDFIRDRLQGDACMVVTDPPYGKIVNEEWDRVKVSDDEFATWMLDWVQQYAALIPDGGAFYMWGGLGTVGFRPLLKFLARVEVETDLTIGNVITWGKKRAYGVQHNYLFCREELVYLFKGSDPKKPRQFQVPLLDEVRGYAGYDAKYPAKSEFKRRTNVWSDITELFRGKFHVAQNPMQVYEIPIQCHTSEGDWVIDPFAGSGTAAWVARKMNRKFIVVENCEKEYNDFLKRWAAGKPPNR